MTAENADQAKRCIAGGVDGIHAGAMDEEDADRFGAVLGHRVVERGPAVCIWGIHVGTVVDEHLETSKSFLLIRGKKGHGQAVKRGKG